MKKEINRKKRAPSEKAAKMEKETSRKIRVPFKKVAKWFVIIVVSLVFLYCILCIIAKVIPDPAPSPITTVETEVPATNTPATTRNSVIYALKSVLVLEDFAYTALGAMFGFGASVILENYILSYTKKKAFTNLVDEIIQILPVLKENLLEDTLAPIAEIPIVDGVVDESVLKDNSIEISNVFRAIKGYKDVVYFPIWESILQNGDLLYFRKEKYFSSLIKVYTHLNKIKHMIDDPDVDEKNTEEMFIFLSQLYSNIKDLLTTGKDFEKSLFDAIDGINKLEHNYNYKKFFEGKS